MKIELPRDTMVLPLLTLEAAALIVDDDLIGTFPKHIASKSTCATIDSKRISTNIARTGMTERLRRTLQEGACQLHGRYKS